MATLSPRPDGAPSSGPRPRPAAAQADPGLTWPSAPAGVPSLDLLRGEYDNMLACIRCGLCLSVCPTYAVTRREEESPRGRIAMARALAEGHLGVTPDLVQHELSCLLCEACTAVCPAGVHMERLGVPLRVVLDQAAPPPPRQRLLARLAFRLFRDMRLFRAMAGALRLYQGSGLQALARALRLPRLAGMQRAEALLPRIDADFLVPEGQQWLPPDGQVRARALLFAGCIMSTAYAEIDRATGRVLAAHGCQVTATRGQGCCGALNAHGGDLDGALEMARRNVDAFEAADPDAWVVVNAAGCGAMLKEYGHLLAGDPAYAERAARFAARVRDVSEVLDGLEPVVPLRAVRARVTYQDPCHLAHAQRVTRQPRRLLGRIPGLELREMPDSSLCCGSAGVYNLAQPGMADELQRRKVASILSTDAEVVVSANPGCMLQVQAGLRAAGRAVRVRHIVEVLDEALGGQGPGASGQESGVKGPEARPGPAGATGESAGRPVGPSGG